VSTAQTVEDLFILDDLRWIAPGWVPEIEAAITHEDVAALVDKLAALVKEIEDESRAWGA